MTQPKYHLSDIFNPDTAHPDESHSVQIRYIPREAHVLELGCATGYMSGYLEQALACHVTGLEYDPESAAIASERCSEVHVVDLDEADALSVASQSAPYDVLYAANVLEHLKYPERVLQEAYHLLKPNARLIVALPNIANWQFRYRLLRGIFDYEDYGVMDKTHTHLYTAKTGRELLQSQGFQVDEMQIAGSLLQHLLNRLARRFNRPLPKPILAGLFAYELIYIAHKPA
ncbi:MAG: methyltransferase domain-containing protein [Anaerolineae bacterium]|nr:methyltransferase domain-containing protein [Anaerolineae bacterium]MDQ7033310.1 methyltransferase domain-containing protein [Anaerolineae bacterium]